MRHYTQLTREQRYQISALLDNNLTQTEIAKKIKAIKKIPKTIESALFRKLQILDAATKESDLRIPPGNRFEYLVGNLHGWCSIRVNKQYRLIFCWKNSIAEDTYLDPHTYKS